MPTHRIVIADEAMDELIELLTYISADSPKNAGAVRAAVARRLDRLARFPQTGRLDRNAPLVPRGAAARITTAKGVSIYYLFPMRRNGGEIVYVVAMRRGSRLPLEDPQYLVRWMEELGKLAPPSATADDDPGHVE
jgi:plasmid stabilization system protein ParE